MKLVPASFVKVSNIAQNTIEFQLKPEQNYRYFAGQYTDIWCELPPVGNSHDFVRSLSFISSPEDTYLTFAFRVSPSYFKQSVISAVPGKKYYLSPPVGYFGRDMAQFQSVMWIAGGIGVTPFVSLWQARAKMPKFIHYVSINRSREQAPYHSFFQKSIEQQSYQLLETADLLPRERDQLIIKQIKNRFSRQYPEAIYISGSSDFVSNLSSIIQSIGMVSEKIRVEDFGHRE